MAVFNAAEIQFAVDTGADLSIWNGPVMDFQLAAANTLQVIRAVQTRVNYDDGFVIGELYGSRSQREIRTQPVSIGESDAKKRRISFHMYNLDGLPASGLLGEGKVCAPSVSQKQTNRDLVGFVNSTGTFTHVGNGVYAFTYTAAEVAAPGGEGNIWFRVKVPGFRTVLLRTPLRSAFSTTTEMRDAVLNAVRSGFVATGSVGEGVAITTALLQGNIYVDTVTNTANGQTSARVRCFHTGAAAQAATQGGSGQGEFATFLVTTSYTGVNKIADHRVVQQ